MNQHYTYLALDLGSILVPLIFSFYSKAPFYKQWKHLWIALLIPAIIFLVWDELFTRAGVWGFNERYLTGIYVGKLPLEEILFFVCIPYACVFTYDALNFIFKKNYLAQYQQNLTTSLSVLLLIIAAINFDKLYTGITLGSLGLFLIFLRSKRVSYLGKFYVAYIVILIPFFIVNGILTGSMIDEEVVWYNDAENLGIRLGTIPVEDIFYGMLLILMNVSILEQLRKNSG